MRIRASRNSNDVIEEEMSFGDRIADTVARFGGSWTFIILFGAVLVLYATVNIVLKGSAWDPYPFILSSF
jgi:CRP/FNR family cyclic AMP-dependent transcriptional regulator